MAERAPGSDQGRPSIDWEDAFLYYASLADTERSYRPVATHFGVSVRTVESHGRQEHWKARLARIKAEAAETADQRIAAARAEKLADLDLLIDASLTAYAQQLRAGKVRVVPADLLRLYKLRDELWAQEAVARGREAAAETSELDPEDPEQRQRDLIAALEEAGAFDRLRNLTGLQPSLDGADDDSEAA